MCWRYKKCYASKIKPQMSDGRNFIRRIGLEHNSISRACQDENESS